jgi:hypothetical protein
MNVRLADIIKGDRKSRDELLDTMTFTPLERLLISAKWTTMAGSAEEMRVYPVYGIPTEPSPPSYRVSCVYELHCVMCCVVVV